MPDEPASLVDTIRSLDRDMAVTVTLADGREFDARVRQTKDIHDDKSFRALLWDDDYQKSDLRINAYDGISVTYRTPDQHATDDGHTVTEVETHGIEIDLDEPVGNEGFPKKVATCPECEGLMVLSWGDMKQSFDYYTCRECDNEETYRYGDDPVRNPTRREWVELRLENTNPFTSVPERYLTGDQQPKGYYYMERCPNDHYQRCKAHESAHPRADNHDEDDLDNCPTCGADLNGLIKTYADGIDEWGEPEDFGPGVPDELYEAIDAVETGEVALALDIPAGDIGPEYSEAFLVTNDEGEVIIDIVGGGTPTLGGTAGGVGRAAYWYNATDDAELISRDEYDQRTATAATC